MGDKTYNLIADDQYPASCHHQATQTRECPIERQYLRKTVTDTCRSDDDFEFEGFLGEEPPPASPTTSMAVTPLTIPPLPTDIDFGEAIRTSDGSRVPSLSKEPGASSKTAEKAAALPPPATRRLDITRALTVVPPPRDFALPCLRAGLSGRRRKIDARRAACIDGRHRMRHHSWITRSNRLAECSDWTRSLRVV